MAIKNIVLKKSIASPNETELGTLPVLGENFVGYTNIISQSRFGILPDLIIYGNEVAILVLALSYFYGRNYVTPSVIFLMYFIGAIFYRVMVFLHFDSYSHRYVELVYDNNAAAHARVDELLAYGVNFHVTYIPGCPSGLSALAESSDQLPTQPAPASHQNGSPPSLREGEIKEMATIRIMERDKRCEWTKPVSRIDEFFQSFLVCNLCCGIIGIIFLYLLGAMYLESISAIEELLKSDTWVVALYTGRFHETKHVILKRQYWFYIHWMATSAFVFWPVEFQLKHFARKNTIWPEISKLGPYHADILDNSLLLERLDNIVWLVYNVIMRAKYASDEMLFWHMYLWNLPILYAIGLVFRLEIFRSVFQGKKEENQRFYAFFYSIGFLSSVVMLCRRVHYPNEQIAIQCACFVLIFAIIERIVNFFTRLRFYRKPLCGPVSKLLAML